MGVSSMIKINGKTYHGNSISIQNGEIIIDGKKQDSIEGTDPTRIVVEGTLTSLSADGSVNCEHIQGNVVAGGSVNCDDVGGDVRAGGSVNCDRVKGAIFAGGSVIHG